MSTTWTYTTTYYPQGTSTGTLEAENTALNISVTGATFTPQTASLRAKGNINRTDWAWGASRIIKIPLKTSWQPGISYWKEITTNAVSNNEFTGWYTATFSSLNTADYFDATNKTTASVTLGTIKVRNGQIVIGSSDTLYVPLNSNSSEFDIATVTATLNVPPTFTASALTIDTASAYSGITTASVTVSDVAAYYGGDVTEVKLTIGSQTATLSGNGTLSILLDTVGTFTPILTVTDSRGQVGSQSFSPLTVNAYSSPTVNFTADRTTSTGTPDDEGTYATLDATFVFSDVIASLIAPSVVLTDENGTQTTPTVTWYSSRAADGTLSGSVTWANLSTGDTVYGLVPGLNTNYSYQVSVRPRDNRTTGTAIIQTVSSAFYTIDFLAGGHGIAFGQPASTTGFVCNMTATFNDDADFGNDVFIELPDYQTASTTDKAIYDAIVALGWDSDVLIP